MIAIAALSLLLRSAEPVEPAPPPDAPPRLLEPAVSLDSASRPELAREIRKLEQERAPGSYFVPAGIVAGLGAVGLLGGAFSGIHLSLFNFSGLAGGGGSSSSSYGLSPEGTAAIAVGIPLLLGGAAWIVALLLMRAEPNRRIAELQQRVDALEPLHEGDDESSKAPELATSQVVTPPAKVPLVPIVALGGAVVAGGLGIGFGLASADNLKSARLMTYASEKEQRRQQVVSQALVADVAFAVAGAAAVTALVTFLVMK